MAWSWERVARVARRVEGGHKPLGSGALVGASHVLTARHVVIGDDGNPKPDLAVRLEGSTQFVSVEVAWPGAPDLDAALLVVVPHQAIASSAPAHPLSILSSRDIDTGRTWEAEGYPIVDADAPNLKRKPVGGQTCACTRGHADLFLDTRAQPTDARGISGAPVVVEGSVVGVMRAVPSNWGGSRLEATPVARFLHLPAFRLALGLRDADNEIERRIARVLTAVTALLRQHPAVTVFLADCLRAAPDPARIAHALVHDRAAGEVARWLNHADDALAESGSPLEPRRAVRALLFQILPLAIDFRSHVVAGFSDQPGGPRVVDLPVRTSTLAEIILAGIDGRLCKFAPVAEGRMPVGAALVALPAGRLAALIDPDGTKLAQLLVQQMAAQFGVDPALGYTDLRDAVRGKLRYYATEAPPRDLVVHYVVLTEGEAARKGEAARAVEPELPLLRFAALGGGSLEHETLLATHIQEVLRRAL